MKELYNFLSDKEGRLETSAETRENSDWDRSSRAIYKTYLLDRQDEQQQSPLFLQTNKNEIEALWLSGIWRTVKVKDNPADCNILGGQFTLRIMN